MYANSIKLCSIIGFFSILLPNCSATTVASMQSNPDDQKSAKADSDKGGQNNQRAGFGASAEECDDPVSKGGSSSHESTHPRASTPPTAKPKEAKVKIEALPMAAVPISPDDPVKGKWTLADATKGMPKTGNLTMNIDTELGAISCKLFDEKAPVTVANIVGVARGLRPWKNATGKWVTKPVYDGTVFHRIIKGFMIQGGDPIGNGTGDTGFVFPDEIWEDSNHDRAGLLCTANRGRNTNGVQFFITDAPTPHLDKRGTYTVFGECAPLDTIHALASVEPDRGDRPKVPPLIKSVKITGGPSPKANMTISAPLLPSSP